MNAANLRRTVFLSEMGIGPLWIHRASELDVRMVAAVVTLPELPQQAPVQTPAIPATSPVTAPVTVAPVTIAAPVTARSQPTASAWDDGVIVPPVPRTPRPLPVMATDADIAGMDWHQLKAAVASCTRCGLCKGRTRTVFGDGDQKATWLFVGEGPGRNEDVQGEPFVGPAGKLLDNMLLAIGLKRGENAYLTNAVKCRPTDANGRDRPPTATEATSCLPYLERQSALIQPAIIVALGKSAALSLLNLAPATQVGALRGTVHRFGDRPVIVTYHPAYLLRSPIEKRKAWEDLCLATATLTNAA